MVLSLGPYITPSIKIIVKILITFHIEQYYGIDRTVGKEKLKNTIALTIQIKVK
jgi:hypothetical protein